MYYKVLFLEILIDLCIFLLSMKEKEIILQIQYKNSFIKYKIKKKPTYIIHLPLIQVVLVLYFLSLIKVFLYLIYS